MAVHCKNSTQLGTLMTQKDFSKLRNSTDMRMVMIQDSSLLEEMDGNITIQEHDSDPFRDKNHCIKELFNYSNLILISRYGYARTSNFYSTYKAKLDLQIHVMADVIKHFCSKLNSMEATFKNTILYFKHWRQYFASQQQLKQVFLLHGSQAQSANSSDSQQNMIFKETPFSLIDFDRLGKESRQHVRAVADLVRFLDDQTVLLNKLLISYQVTIQENLDNLKQKGEFSQLIEYMASLQKDFSSSFSKLSKQLYSNQREPVLNPYKNLFIIEFKMCTMMKLLKTGVQRQAQQLQNIELQMVGTITENYNLIVGSLEAVQAKLGALLSGFHRVELIDKLDTLEPLEYAKDIYLQYQEYIKKKMRLGKYKKRNKHDIDDYDNDASTRQKSMSEIRYEEFEMMQSGRETQTESTKTGELLIEGIQQKTKGFQGSKKKQIERQKSDIAEDHLDDINSFLQDAVAQKESNEYTLTETMIEQDLSPKNQQQNQTKEIQEEEAQSNKNTQSPQKNSSISPKKSPQICNQKQESDIPLNLSKNRPIQAPQSQRRHRDQQSKKRDRSPTPEQLRTEFDRQQREALRHLKSNQVLSEEDIEKDEHLSQVDQRDQEEMETQSNNSITISPGFYRMEGADSPKEQFGAEHGSPSFGLHTYRKLSSSQLMKVSELEQEEQKQLIQQSQNKEEYTLKNSDVIQFFMDNQLRFNRESMFMINSTVCRLWKPPVSEQSPNVRQQSKQQKSQQQQGNQAQVKKQQKYCILALDIFGNMIIIYRERDDHLASYNFTMEKLKEMLSNRIGFYVPLTRIEAKMNQREGMLSINVTGNEKGKSFIVKMEVIDEESTKKFLKSIQIYKELSDKAKRPKIS